MTGTGAKVGNVEDNRLVKFVIVAFVFPIFVLVFHLLLIIPAFFVNFLLVHFGGNPKVWARILSVLAFLPACWGAAYVCKWVWPRSK